MLRLGDVSNNKSYVEIRALVNSDLMQMRQIIGSNELLTLIGTVPIHIISNDDEFQEAYDCETNRLFFHELADFFVKDTSMHDLRIRTLSNAFYGIANNLHLQWALTSDLLNLDVSFDNYFELYLIGIDYAVCADRICVIDHRAKHTTST